MKKLRKSKPVYTKILNHFRKQYKDVSELLYLYITADNQICGGEWIDSKGVHNIADSVDTFETAKIVD